MVCGHLAVTSSTHHFIPISPYSNCLTLAKKLFFFWDPRMFSCSVVSDSLWPHELQHTRPPCPSPTPRVYSNSCPLSRWCHPAISSSVVPFSSCPQSLPASGSFPVSQLFASSGPSIGVSASASVLPMNTQDWSPLGWTGWISCCPRDSKESSPTPQFKSINFLVLSFLHSPTLTSMHDHWENLPLHSNKCWKFRDGVAWAHWGGHRAVAFSSRVHRYYLVHLPSRQIAWLDYG